MTNNTNRKLIKFHQQLLQMEANDSIILFLNRSKIKDFMSNNLAKIQTVYRKMDEINRSYYVYEIPLDLGVIDIKSAKKVEPTMKMVGEGKDAKPVLQEGKLEIMMEKEIDDLLNTQIEIH